MIATWMLFAIVTGTFFGVAALAAARAAAASRRPTRVIWFVALLTAALWPLMALVASRGGDPAIGTGILIPPLTIVARQSRAFTDRVWAGSLGRSLEVILLVTWAVTTTILVARLVRALRELRRQRESWLPDQVDGVRVRISRDVGPAVVGVGSMEIVLPEWALTLDRPLLAMVLRHEEEHRRAGDPRLLFVAALVVALVPWNLVLWWCARRLRLAIELDCDARVLAVHEQPERYSLLLMMMAQRGTAATADFAPALTNPTSNLERRIVAMRRALPRFARVQLLAFSALAAATVAVACSVENPEAVTASKSTDVAPSASGSKTMFEFKVAKPVLLTASEPQPVYPEALKSAHIEGDVLVQFVVDGAGHADMGSFKVLKSSHTLFTQSVKDVLPAMRFEPAEVAGRKVRQLVQMPFAFKLP
jgi:TonB family protein